MGMKNFMRTKLSKSNSDVSDETMLFEAGRQISTGDINLGESSLVSQPIYGSEINSTLSLGKFMTLPMNRIRAIINMDEDS